MFPLLPEEQEAIIAVARELDSDTEFPHPYGKSYEQTFLLMLFTGFHPRVITSKWDAPPRVIDQGGQKFFVWRRTKKKGAKGTTMIPVAKRLLPFAEEFLKNLPSRRQAYNEILNNLERAVLKRHPELKNIHPLCPLKMRHSFGIEMLRLGMAPSELKQLMNVSGPVLDFYLKMSPAQLVGRLKETGFI